MTQPGRRWATMMPLQVELTLTWLRAHVARDNGASLIEYALLLALIAVVCIAAISFLGSNTSTSYSNVANSLSN